MKAGEQRVRTMGVVLRLPRAGDAGQAAVPSWYYQSADVCQVLGELLTVTRALTRSLAEPDRGPDFKLLTARASLVDRLRGLLDSDPGQAARLEQAVDELRELQGADRQLRRAAAARAHMLGEDFYGHLSRQRITLRGYLGGIGGLALPYC